MLLQEYLRAVWQRLGVMGVSPEGVEPSFPE